MRAAARDIVCVPDPWVQWSAAPSVVLRQKNRTCVRGLCILYTTEKAANARAKFRLRRVGKRGKKNKGAESSILPQYPESPTLTSFALFVIGVRARRD